MSKFNMKLLLSKPCYPNVGHIVLDYMAQFCGLSNWTKYQHGKYAYNKVLFDKQPVILVKLADAKSLKYIPTTFLCNYHDVSKENLILMISDSSLQVGNVQATKYGYNSIRLNIGSTPKEYMSKEYYDIALQEVTNNIADFMPILGVDSIEEFNKAFKDGIDNSFWHF